MYDARPTSSRPARSAPSSTTTPSNASRWRSSPAGPTINSPSPATALELEKKGILYAPDYVINGGGVINVYGELQHWTMERAKRKAQEIYDTMLRVFAIASRDKIPSFEAADRLAEERIRSVAGLKKMWLEGDR